MLDEPTMEQLQQLKLHGFLHALHEQQADSKMARLSFDERLAMLVEAEWLDRQNKRLVRNLRAAKLKLSQACVENIDYSPKRHLDKTVIRQLGKCKWVDEHHNIVITGATGVGKTYIACALAQQACRKGHKALYRRVSRLFDEMELARADGSYGRVLARLARIDVLVLDDWGLVAVGADQRRDINEIMEDRYGTRSTILTSQLPVSKWHDHIGDPTTADAICDRILNNAHRLVLKGPSRRKENSTKTN